MKRRVVPVTAVWWPRLVAIEQISAEGSGHLREALPDLIPVLTRDSPDLHLPLDVPGPSAPRIGTGGGAVVHDRARQSGGRQILPFQEPMPFELELERCPGARLLAGG